MNCMCLLSNDSSNNFGNKSQKILEPRPKFRYMYIFVFPNMVRILCLFKHSIFRQCKGRRGVSWRRKNGMYKVLWFLENVWPNRCAKYITKISDSICIYLHLLFKNSNPLSILSSTSLGFQQNGVNLKKSIFRSIQANISVCHTFWLSRWKSIIDKMPGVPNCCKTIKSV